MPRVLEPGEVAAKLERITGLDVRVAMDKGDPPWRAFTGDFAAQRMVFVTAATDKELIRRFLQTNLSNCRDILMVQQCGKCIVCTSRGPLELDHIKPRSRGRDDRIENLQLACHPCHRRKTGEPQWSRSPDQSTSMR